MTMAVGLGKIPALPGGGRGESYADADTIPEMATDQLAESVGREHSCTFITLRGLS